MLHQMRKQITLIIIAAFIGMLLYPVSAFADKTCPEPKPDVWYDFRIVAEGFSVTMYINGKKSVSSDDLSCRTGGFSFEPYGIPIYLKDLKVKINKTGD